MASLDLRMEATVFGSDGDSLGRTWAMRVGKEGRDFFVTHLLVEGGAFERDALLPFGLVAICSDQRVILRMAKGEALLAAEMTAPESSILLRRNHQVYAVDARLGHVRGFYVEPSGKISDLLINDEVARRLSMASIRSVEEITPQRVQLADRIAAMGELLKPPQAFYEPVELRPEAELVHGTPGAHGAQHQG